MMKNFIVNLRILRVKIISPKISIEKFFEYNNENIIIEELVELSNPDVFTKNYFRFSRRCISRC